MTKCKHEPDRVYCDKCFHEEMIMPDSIIRKYTLIVTEDENGVSIKGETNGFNAFEILGFLDWKKDDIRQQIRGSYTPDIVERVVVKDGLQDEGD